MTTTTITTQKPKRTFKSFFPIVEWLPKYKSSWLRFDVIASLTVWALLVPEAMAYAGIALVLIIMIGLSYGASFSDLYVMGIALAIAAIPTGMPVVVTLILAMGATEMATGKAIIKRLPAVETLGSTSAICSDKTGTLTLNQMTARELVIAGNQYSVTGQGYDSNGEFRHVGGVRETDLDPNLSCLSQKGFSPVKIPIAI